MQRFFVSFSRLGTVRISIQTSNRRSPKRPQQTKKIYIKKIAVYYVVGALPFVSVVSGKTSISKQKMAPKDKRMMVFLKLSSSGCCLAVPGSPTRCFVAVRPRPFDVTQ